ncbi:MAG: ABC transporter permease [Ignavibacteria bacterium]|nr:ABC transporter permease [Ignavibacteria bacterium]
MPVISVISNTLPFTLIFASISFALQISISLLLIFFISQRRNSFFDILLNKLNLIFYSIPTMIIGMFLIYFFSLQLNLLPMSDLHSIDFDNAAIWEKLLDYAKHMILPLATLSLPGIIVFYGYLRNNIDEVYKKSFVLFLRGCGMKESKIFSNHVLPNSVEPLISVLGTELGILLGGTLITENIFGLPGMGRLIVDSILTRDYPLVVGCVFVSAILVILANILADLVKVIINKKLAAEYF